MLQVGLIGLGAIGRMHFASWRRCPHARLAAVAARDPKLRAGDWAGRDFNLGPQAMEQVAMDDLTAYEQAEELLSDPEVEAVDICTATPQHAPLAIAALRAGKHVLCEKPMGLSIEECLAMEAAARESGRLLVVAHCLRYWPHYVRAHQIIQSGEYGAPLHARFERTGAAPAWSSGGWLMDPAKGGGILDMHIHDVDIALWWFGQPASVHAEGWSRAGLPMTVDATWRYPGDMTAHLYSSWDPHGGAFRHAFRVVLEAGTLSYDLAATNPGLQLWQDGKAQDLPVAEANAYQAEIDDFARCAAAGLAFDRFSPSDSRRAVEYGLQEMAQLKQRR